MCLNMQIVLYFQKGRSTAVYKSETPRSMTRTQKSSFLSQHVWVGNQLVIFSSPVRPVIIQESCNIWNKCNERWKVISFITRFSSIAALNG